MKLTSVILAGFLMFPASSWPQEVAAPENEVTLSGLSPGDQINIRMFDFPDVGALQTHVGTDGTVHLPYAGTIQVAGMTPREVEKAVVDALRTKEIVKDPNVTVDVVSASSLSISILGQVLNPRSISVYAPVPISYVLAQAGGITGLAAHHLTIIHSNQQAPTTVDYDPDAPTGAMMNTLVRSGDIVNVSNRGVYFVAGEVGRPGIYPLGGALSTGQANATIGFNVTKSMTLLQAIAQAGGVTAIASRSKMHILRTTDGKREVIIVDEVKLYKGEVADPILHADDIIYVPSSYFRQQTNNIFGTALSSLYAAIQVRQFN